MYFTLDVWEMWNSVGHKKWKQTNQADTGGRVIRMTEDLYLNVIKLGARVASW